MRPLFRTRGILLAAIVSMAGWCAQVRQNRYVVIDQDAMGPAGTDMNSIILFL